MENWQTRSEALFGAAGLAALSRARVAVFGLGGVGGHAAEALVRGGVGAIDLFDHDTISPTNLNRQLAATVDKLGQSKAQVLGRRFLTINPALRVTVHESFYLPENAADYPLDAYDYVVDAVDTVAAKLELICRAEEAGTPIVSALGCGNKLDPTAFRVADLFETDTDPLARVLRRELRKRGIDRLKVVWSAEPPRAPLAATGDKGAVPGRPAPGSVSFVPGVAGMILAGEVLKDLAGLA